MGPIKSFQNNYTENLNKRKKPKRQSFSGSSMKTIDGIIPEKRLSVQHKAEIIAERKNEKGSEKRRLAIAYAILAFILISTILISTM